MPVEHGAVHGGEGVARDDGGLDGQLLDVRFDLLLRRDRSETTLKRGLRACGDAEEVVMTTIQGDDAQFRELNRR